MRSDVQKRIDDLLRDIPREECRTCDCLLGFVTRLKLDARENTASILRPMKALKDQIHGCLGCNPCPPAEAYSNYIRENLAGKVKK